MLLKNGVTFMPSGLLPGFYASHLPLYLCNLVDHVDELTVQSGEDDPNNISSWVKFFGYGLDPDKFPQDRLRARIAAYYIAAVYEMGDRLELKFDDVKVSHEVFTAPHDLQTKAFGLVKKGTMIGHRFIMSGYVKGKKKVNLIYVHKICNDIIKEPAINVEVQNMIPLEESYVTSAVPSVDVIPQCVNAPATSMYLTNQQ